MKSLLKLGGSALIAATFMFAGSASAYPDIPCTVAGQQTTTPLASGYNLWYCDGESWVFLLQYYCDPSGNCIPL